MNFLKKSYVFVIFSIIIVGSFFCILLLRQSNPFSSRISVSSEFISGEKIIWNRQKPICFTGVQVGILMFHYVEPDENVPKVGYDWGNAMPPETFDMMMMTLVRHRDRGEFATVFVDDLIDFAARDCYPAPHILALTADDGEYNDYEYLFPVIEKYRVPFSFAIIDSKVATGATSHIENYMNRFDIEKSLRSGFVRLLDHTAHHLDLRTLSDTKAYQEMCGSKQRLESLFGVTIRTLVYPSGAYNEHTQQIAQECGYDFGLTTHYGLADFSKPLELSRIRIGRDTSMESLLWRVFEPGFYHGSGAVVSSEVVSSERVSLELTGSASQ